MEKRTAVAIFAAVTVVLAAVFALQFTNRFRLATLSRAELAFKSPSPPDDTCFRIERQFAELPAREAVAIPNPPGSDELAIYQAVLERWNSKPGARLNVSNKTVPLDRDISDCQCLKAIDIQSFSSATTSFHFLPRNAFGARSIHLVDAEEQASIVRANDPSKFMSRGVSVDAAVENAFANGLFQLSEVAFDKEHRRAIVSYSFVCGSLCGSGGVWLFERVDGVWKKSEHTCGGWVS